MAYITTADARHDFTAAAASARRPNLFARLFHAVVAGRQSAVDREIAAYLHANGKFLSDQAEREIERRILARPQF